MVPPWWWYVVSTGRKCAAIAPAILSIFNLPPPHQLSSNIARSMGISQEPSGSIIPYFPLASSASFVLRGAHTPGMASVSTGSTPDARRGTPTTLVDEIGAVRGHGSI